MEQEKGEREPRTGGEGATRQPDGDPGRERKDARPGGERPEGGDQPSQDEREGGYGGSTGGKDLVR